MSALAAPHADRVARFDRWAHRVASASGAWRSPSALEETAFSQVRSDRSVLGAWIERDDVPALAYPSGVAPPSADYRSVRVATLGTCDVATTRLAQDGADVSVVVVRMDHDGLRTTLALARTPRLN